MADDPAHQSDDDAFWSIAGQPPAAPAPSALPVEPVEGGAEAIAPPASKHRTRIVLAVVAAVVVAGGVVAAVRLTSSPNKTVAASASTGAGATPGRGRGGAFGTLASVNGGTLTITTQAGQTVKVTTSSSTTFTRSVTGSLSDVKTGDLVIATGTPDASGVVTATRLLDQGVRPPGQAPGAGGFGGRRGQDGQPPPNGAADGGQTQPPDGNGPGGGGAAGTVKSVNGSTLVLSSFGGADVTVNATPATVVSVLKTVKLADLAIGQQVTVRGTTAADGTVAASSVQEGVGGFAGRRRATTDTTVSQ